MSRVIVFLAHKLESIEFVSHDPRTLEPHDTRREKYAEMRKELDSYGTVASSRTSGVMPRPSTPPGGISYTQEAREASEMRGKIRTQRALMELIDKTHHLVAAIDGESETRGSLIEYAHARKKGILLLQQAVAIVNFRPMYENRDGITYHIYENTEQMKHLMLRYFHQHPLRLFG